MGPIRFITACYPVHYGWPARESCIHVLKALQSQVITHASPVNAQGSFPLDMTSALVHVCEGSILMSCSSQVGVAGPILCSPWLAAWRRPASAESDVLPLPQYAPPAAEAMLAAAPERLLSEREPALARPPAAPAAYEAAPTARMDGAAPPRTYEG